jgi:hypothetical protein
MKTLQEQYNLIEEGKGHKDVFLKSAKRLFPDLIPNHFGYDVTSKILKQRGIITEVIIASGIVSQPAINPFDQFNKFVNEYTTYKWDYEVQEDPATPQTPVGAQEVKSVNKEVSKEVVDSQKVGHDYKNDKDIDNVYGEEFLKGYYAEMKDPANADKTVDELKAIVAKNLYKDPLYYVKNGQFGTKDVGYTDKAPGLTASKTDQMTPIPDQVKPKASKTDLGDREKKTGAAKKVKGEMTITPKSSKGVKKMPLPGKEKKIRLQENNIRSLISQLIKEELREAWEGAEFDTGKFDDGPQPPDDMDEIMIWNSLSPDEAIFFVGKEWDSIPDDVTANILRDDRFYGEVDIDEGEVIITTPSGTSADATSAQKQTVKTQPPGSTIKYKKPGEA